MIWNLILKDNKEDIFSVEGNTLHFHDYHLQSKDNLIKSGVAKTLADEGVQFSHMSNELINMALTVYGSDQLISRSKNAYDSWSRGFRLYLPVKNTKVWEEVKGELESMLSFLSGDNWQLFIRESKNQLAENVIPSKFQIDEVTLFSGGLDSLIGAVDLLERGKNIFLVGHHKSQGYELDTQKKLFLILKEKYSNQTIKKFFTYAQPNQASNLSGKERSSRARSILFITLGLAVANSFGESIPLVIPENGLISLNIPLTNSRMGSLSTRTTHPYFLGLFEKIVRKLGFKNPIYNPYWDKTKGEMLENCLNKTVLEENAPVSISCAKPGYHKQWHNKEELHCGYCTPCLIRRAAMKRAKIDVPSHYAFKVEEMVPDPLTDMGRDYRAFQMSIARMKQNKKNILFDILTAGPLTFSEKPILDFLDVYKRGMLEVENFLNNKS